MLQQRQIVVKASGKQIDREYPSCPKSSIRSFHSKSGRSYLSTLPYTGLYRYRGTKVVVATA
ncbi:MAG TPA: hypothetical protein VKA91_03320 [Nitrososphaeraceae archaeon]|nr:hypothetical protein [Nitrososphaeraceae archaeon]